MKNHSTLLNDIISFQEFLEKRGYEKIMAKGCNYTLRKKSVSIEFGITSVGIKFDEFLSDFDICNGIRRQTDEVFLSITEIEMSEDEWVSHIKNIKLNSAKQKLRKLQIEQKYSVTNYIRKIDEAQKEYHELKKELE